MIGWWLAAAAAAATGDATWWAGEWGVDPSRSDDPSLVIERAYVGSAATTGGASQFSPDPNATDVDVDAARRKLLYKLMAVLGRSGRLSLADEADGAVRLGWGDGEALRLEPGGKWTRVTDPDGDRYKIRVRQEPTWFLVERKVQGAVITETFVPPADAAAVDGRELVVVVSIVGNELASGVEFRRVYRSL